MHPGLLQIGPKLEESGQMSGARWLQVFRRIVIPLLLPALFAAWIFVFLISLRELAAAALLYTAKSAVIATKMLDLWQNGNINQVSALGTIVAILSMGFALAAYGVRTPPGTTGLNWGISGGVSQADALNQRDALRADG